VTLSLSLRRQISSAFIALCALCALSTVLFLFYIILYLFRQGISYINFSFFVESPAPLGQTGGGASNSLVGSAIMVSIASVIGIPIGLGIGIFVAEYAARGVAGFVRFLADVLSGVPSIVVGIFIYQLIVVPQGHFSGLAGALALAVIMLPIVARASEEMLKLVPASQREAALALGVPRWRTILSVVLPAARAGLLTAGLLAMARISGESAPLLFTALGNNFFTTNVDQPMDALPLRIYRYAIGPYDEWHRQAWAAAFMLILLVFLISIVARFIVGRQRGGR
jgi:phosphate transport system permease protein